MTPKQKQLLEFIHSFSQEHAYPPSQQEIANHFGWKSLGTVQDYLRSLAKQGLVHSHWNAKRALQIDKKFAQVLEKKGSWEKEKALAVPVVGKIAAGKPIDAIQMEERQTVWMSDDTNDGGSYFALEVQGLSMIEEGIIPGDYIIVRKQPNPSDGDTVVALLEDGATVKKIYQHGERIELRPANQQMQSLWVEKGQCLVQGIIVGLYRNYSGIKKGSW